MPTASYLTRRALAAELMISESTVDDFVRRGLLPRPIRLSPGCVRWRWATVDEVLRASEGRSRDCEGLSPQESAERAARVIAASRERSRSVRKPKSG